MDKAIEFGAILTNLRGIGEANERRKNKSATQGNLFKQT